MSRYHGKGGMVYASATGSGVAVPVAYLTNWSLDMATDKVEVTAFQDANKTYVQGLKDVKGNINGFWDSATDQLFDASESADGIKMYLYPSLDAPTIYFYGPAWLDASINVAVDGAITLTSSFVANGSWGRKP